MDLFKAIKKRRSIRKFKPQPVADEDLRSILEAGHLAPSGANRQPWQFLVIRSRETKEALATASNNQKFIADAETVLVALGEPRSGGNLPYKLSSTRIPHIQDPMIAVEHMILAATALGYGTCWIVAFDQDEIKNILKIPDKLVVVALLPIGVPDESPRQRPRKPFQEIFFKETYGITLEL
jgi:nitroreductase